MSKYYGYCYNEEGKFNGEIIPVEYTVDEETWEETPLLPPNCTLEVPPDGIYYPVFKDGQWIKTVENPPELIPKPPEKTDVEKLRDELEKVKKDLEAIKVKLGG